MTDRNSPWTIRSILEWTTGYFRDQGIDSPRLDAELLLSHALSANRIKLYLCFDQPLVQEELDAFRALVRRRAGREPVAYILGKKEFWSLEFSLTPDVLIPRPETEILVQVAQETLGGAESGKKRVLELGAGSGAVICALAAERPGHFFAALDRSPAALAVARANAAGLQLDGAISFLASDWFSGLGRSLSFDLVVSNPPYISQRDLAGLMPEVRLFEPLQALDGGPDGLDPIRHIIEKTPEYLVPDGALILEYGSDQKQAIREIAGKAGVWQEPEFFKDYAGLDRVVKLVLE